MLMSTVTDSIPVSASVLHLLSSNAVPSSVTVLGDILSLPTMRMVDMLGTVALRESWVTEAVRVLSFTL